MGIVQTLMSRWSNAWTQRVDCYNGRHKMKPEKYWIVGEHGFIQRRCKCCGVRKVHRYLIVD